jgi:hypothetical protein
MTYNVVIRQASILSYLDQYRHFGLLILFLVPLVLLLKRPAVDRDAPAEAIH